MPHPAVCTWSDLAVNQLYNWGSWISHQAWTFCLFHMISRVYADSIHITKTQVLSWFDKLSDGDELPSWYSSQECITGTILTVLSNSWLWDASCLHHLLFTGSNAFQTIGSTAICSNWYLINIFLSNTRVFDLMDVEPMSHDKLIKLISSWFNTSLIRDLEPHETLFSSTLSDQSLSTKSSQKDQL